MLKVNIICVGRLKEKYWRDACEEYSKRMRAFADFSIIEVDEEKLPDKPSDANIGVTLEKEGKRILSRIPEGSAVFALCIEGREVDSPGLAHMIDRLPLNGYSAVSFIIGGSWGLSEEVKKAAKFRLSMSPMTFPHQLARVMLCEQLYRSFQISSGGKYHK